MDPQVWVGVEEPQPDKVEPVEWNEKSPPKKASGGLWTSTLTHRGNGTVKSGWIEWMQGECWCNVPDPEAWILYPEDDLEVYKIDSLADAIAIMIPDERLKGYSTQEYRVDWDDVFEEYDGIWLTDKGQWETRFPNKCTHNEQGEREWGKVRDGYRCYNLYGWDSECVFWDGWHFEEVEYAGEVEIPEMEY